MLLQSVPVENINDTLVIELHLENTDNSDYDICFTPFSVYSLHELSHMKYIKLNIVVHFISMFLLVSHNMSRGFLQ